MEKTFDGSFTREELENTLNVTEQLQFVRLKKLEQRAAPPPANTGTFDNDPSPDPPKPLIVVELASNAELPITIARQLTQKHNLVCSGKVFISGNLIDVAVFR